MMEVKRDERKTTAPCVIDLGDIFIEVQRREKN